MTFDLKKFFKKKKKEKERKYMTFKEYESGHHR